MEDVVPGKNHTSLMFVVNSNNVSRRYRLEGQNRSLQIREIGWQTEGDGAS
jgi:hypothetical protein